MSEHALNLIIAATCRRYLQRDYLCPWGDTVTLRLVLVVCTDYTSYMRAMRDRAHYQAHYSTC
jgi:hypothetical protein